MADGPQPLSCVPSPRGSSFGAGRVLDSRVRSSLTCRGIPTCCTPPPCSRQLPPAPVTYGLHCSHHIWSPGERGCLYWGRPFFLPSPCPPNGDRQPCKQLPARADPGFPPSLRGRCLGKSAGSDSGFLGTFLESPCRSLTSTREPASAKWSSMTCLSNLLTFTAPHSPGLPWTGATQLPNLTSSPA